MNEARTALACPRCGGRRGSECFYDSEAGSGVRWVECSFCSGLGEVDEAAIARFRDGQSQRAARIAAGISLRERAKELGISPASLSRMESGEP